MVGVECVACEGLLAASNLNDDVRGLGVTRSRRRRDADVNKELKKEYDRGISGVIGGAVRGGDGCGVNGGGGCFSRRQHLQRAEQMWWLSHRIKTPPPCTELIGGYGVLDTTVLNN